MCKRPITADADEEVGQRAEQDQDRDGNEDETKPAESAPRRHRLPRTPMTSARPASTMCDRLMRTFVTLKSAAPRPCVKRLPSSRPRLATRPMIASRP